MTLQKVAEFTKDPELNRQLLTLQSNVEKALAELTDERRVVLIDNTGMLARLGDLAVARPNATLELVLAEPRAGDDGRTLEVIKPTGTGTITIRPAKGTVNGAATQALTAVGLYRFKAWRGAYWRAP
jgi:hypothetical protein